jgi:hypothetical protein
LAELAKLMEFHVEVEDVAGEGVVKRQSGCIHFYWGGFVCPPDAATGEAVTDGKLENVEVEGDESMEGEESNDGNLDTGCSKYTCPHDAPKNGVM